MPPSDLAPVLVFGIMCMVPIVSILVRHQQKMAIIMRTNAAQIGLGETEAIKRELGELKDLMHQQAIAIDNLARKVEASSELSARLEGTVR